MAKIYKSYLTKVKSPETILEDCVLYSYLVTAFPHLFLFDVVRMMNIHYFKCIQL